MSATELTAITSLLKKAKVVEDVFGPLTGTTAQQQKALTAKFRAIVKDVHPDLFNGTKSEKRASDLFAQVNTWRDVAEQKITDGTYGDKKPFAPKAAPVGPQVIKTAKRVYVVTKHIATGDVSDVFHASYEAGGVTVPCVFKVAKDASVNDLMENESKILNEVYPAAQADEKNYRYLVKPLDSFMFRDKGVNRRINVLSPAPGFVSLADVMAEYPKGLDFRDVAWMFKRMLVAIGFAHEKKVIHGAIVPANVLVHPVNHGAKLIDWCYAVKAGGTIKAISAPYKDYYPYEVLNKKVASSQTDIFMAAQCAVALMGGDVKKCLIPDVVPAPVRSFFLSCLLARQTSRPDNAWDLHDDFNQILERVVGKKKYRPLAMPARAV